MKKLLLACATAVGVWGALLGTAEAQQSQYTYFQQRDESFFEMSLSPRNAYYYQYWVPANTIGVLTLHNVDRRSNVNVYAYASPDRTALLS